MFEPIINNRIDTEGLRFDIHLADVEELNQAAQKETYDITKLSFNAYTQLTDKYQLLNSGSALGRKCGPLLISKKELEPNTIDDMKIAIPGYNTTANFLMSFAYPNADDKKALLFSDIEEAVLHDEVDLGVIIHENRFTFQEKGLVQVKDLGEHWEEKTGFPIPLGGIVTRRYFTPDLKAKIDRVIARSVAYALDNPDSGTAYVSQYAQEMSTDVMKAHINLYVNEFSINIGKEGKQSIQYLFEHHPNVDEWHKPLFVESSEKEVPYLSADYWSTRYQNKMTGWDVGHITTPLKSIIDTIIDKSAKILVPGVGYGHEVKYLIDQGFTNVHVCDIAQKPLDHLRSQYPQLGKIQIYHEDFFKLEGKYDIILEQTFFCALDPELRESYVKKMSDLLRDTGELTGVLFGMKFPFHGPPFGGSIQEYKTLFSKKFNKISIEKCHNSIPQRKDAELIFSVRK